MTTLLIGVVILMFYIKQQITETKRRIQQQVTQIKESLMQPEQIIKILGQAISLALIKKFGR